MDDRLDQHMTDRVACELALEALLEAVVWTPVPPPAAARDDPALPYPTHAGVLELPGLGRVPCYRLSSGERVFEAEAVLRVLGFQEDDEECYRRDLNFQ